MAAFNNGFPVTYPQMFYQPAIPQMMQPQIPAQPQPPTPAAFPQTQSGIIWVGSEQEAQNYPVAPNNAVALWDSSRPAVYLKQADASGKPVIKTYDLVERTEMPRTATAAVSVDKDTPYAKKIDVDALSATVDDLRAELDGMRKELSRKATRKKEADPDDE